MRASDRDRELATGRLREQYARGRLTLEQFSQRTDRVLTAETQGEIEHALWGLPGTGLAGLPLPLPPLARDLIAQGQEALRGVLRGAALIALTGAYLMFSLGLVLVLAIVLLVSGASEGALIAFLVIWLVPTYFLVRLWYRRRHFVARAYRRL